MAQNAPPRPPGGYSRSQLQQAAAQDATKYGVDPNIFARQINQESGWNPAAHSGAGAQGIAQFMPSTAKSYGIDPNDPLQSLDAAARYDASELKAFGGDYHKALAAYNAGAGNADKWNDPSFAGGQTYNYVRDILGGQTPQTPPPGHGHQSAPPSLVSAAAGGQQYLPGAPLPDFRAELAQGLAGAASSPTHDLTGFYGTLQKALQARNQANTQQASPLPPAAHVASLGQTSGTPMLSPAQIAKLSHGRIVGDTTGENSSLVQSLAALAAYEHAPVDLTSGYRSTAKQAQLYANRASNPNPVAPPGHSLHERGLAADGTVGGVPLGTLPAAVLRRFGLATVPGDPVHVQVAR